MASGKTDNLMSAILAHGRDPMTGEYLSPQQRKELFKKAKISGSKVFGTGGGGGSFKGGGGGAGRTGGLAGGALAIRSPGAIATNDVSQKLENILVLLKADADTEQKYRESLFEKQRIARERLLRGGAEDRLEGKDKERTQKVEKAKKGMEVQIPFLEKLAKFLMIYLAGWTTDKLINMFSAKAEGNIAQFLKYRDVLINSLGKFFAPVANIANGFAIWIAKTTKRIAGFAANVGKKIFTPFFNKIRNIAVGMLNRLKSLVQNPLKAVTEKVVKPVITRTQDLLKSAAKKAGEVTPNLLKSLGKKGAGFIRAGRSLITKGGKVAAAGSQLVVDKAGGLLQGVLGKGGDAIGKGLKKVFNSSLLGVLLSSFFDVRERLAKGQSPTQAVLAGGLYGLGSGVTSGLITGALGASTGGLGTLVGLIAGGFLGDMVGKVITGPIDDWFAKNKPKENAFDQYFTKWMNDQGSGFKSALGWDTRQANGGAQSPPPSAPKNGKGQGGGMGGMTSGVSGVPASSLTPSRSRGGRNAPAVIPVPSGGASAPRTIPNKQMVTDIPNVEPTNNDNPYLSFAYSVYNVLV